MPTYLYWRGQSLWCRFPFAGKPEAYPLGIRRISESKTETRRCMAEGERAIAALRTRLIEGRFFEKKAEEEEHYNPTYCVMAMRYWFYHLRFKKSGKNEIYHLAHSIKAFGPRKAREIDRNNIELWMNEMIKAGSSVNAVNNRFSYLKAAYRYSNTESLKDVRLEYDPTIGIKKMKGGRVRQFVLTKETFERNYKYLEKVSPRFAVYYLALWETGRRPWEVARYTWDMVDLDELLIYVPEELNKTKQCQTLPISDRLFSVLIHIPVEERTGPVFKNELRRQWRDCRHHIEKLRQRFGQEAGWMRDTRRGFITHKCEVQGCDPAHVQDFSGHATAEVFKRYRIGKLENLRKVANGNGTKLVQFRKTG